MPSFCLVPRLADAFKAKLKSGELDPAKLADMSSEARRAVFEDFLGKADAHEVNTLFESKLLLKNQQTGMINWAKQVAGMKPEVLKDIVSKINNMDKLLNPKSEKAFLEDLAAKKLGAEVTMEEATKISQMAKDVTEKKGAVNKESPKGSIERTEYGASKIAFQKYLNELKGPTESEFVNPFKQKGAGAKVEAIATDIKESVKFIANNTRSLVASVDNSLWGNQGIRVLLNPKYTGIWKQDFLKSFNDLYQSLKGNGDAVLDATKAEIISRPNAMNGRYENKGGRKLDIGISEEEFPTSFPSRLGEIPGIKNIPVLKQIFSFAGRVFKASEVAYEAGAMRLRADLADKIYDMKEKTGFDLSNKDNVGSINTLVNEMTGRGFTSANPNKGSFTNAAFFSVKFFKSNVDFLTAHVFDSKVKPEIKFEAAKNIVYVMATTAVLLGINKGLDKDPNYNPFALNGTDLGKLKFGNTRVNIAPYASIITLMARIFTQSTRNSQTGKVTKLGARDKKGDPVYGGRTGMEAFWDFTENKFSPMFSILADLAKQQTFDRSKPTLANESEAIFTPMSVQTGIELQKDKGSDVLLDILLNGLNISGFNANTYSQPPKK